MSAAARSVPPLQDAEARDARIDEIFAEDGYAKTDPEGNIVRLKDKVAERVAGVLVAKAVAKNPDERLERAMPGVALYPEAFPHGPDVDAEDDLEREVARQLVTMITSLTQPSSQGRVQRKLASIQGAMDLLLCRRTFDRETGPCYYLTRDHSMIIEDYVTPASEKVVKTAGKYKSDMNLVGRRQPKLAQRIVQELEATVRKTAAELGVTTALESGRP